MRTPGWLLAPAALLAAACTGTVGAGGAGAAPPPTGAAGATTSPPDTTIAPPGATPMPVDPRSDDAARACAPAIAPAPLRRLSWAEYQATTKDLLGGLKTADAPLTRDPTARGFENRAALLNPAPALVEQYGDAAIAAGLQVAGAMAQALPCAPRTAAEEKACGAQFVAAFGARAFRRPLTAEETTDYTTFFEGERAMSDFKGAVQLTTEALLQAPQFLYRAEVGDPSTAASDRVALTPYEIATRLSYLIVGSMPDQALFDSAKAGGLATAEGREAQARRLLKDPRAGAMMVEFHRQWLDLDRLDREPKDRATYPKYDDTLKNAIREESNRFVQQVMWQGPGTIAAFLSSPQSTVNAPLAALYGVAAPATGWGDVTLDPTQRAGFLTRANFLASRAHQLAGSPPLRAVFVRERLLCLPPLAPPADANLAEPKASAGDGTAPAQTNRQLFEARIVPAACKGCHAIINPIGYGLESYDAVGAYRTTDDGLPVDASGAVIGSDVDGPFTGGVELSQKLAGSKAVQACVAQTWFEYALGRDLGPEDTCRMAKLNLALDQAGGDVRELLVSLIKSPEIVFRPPVKP